MLGAPVDYVGQTAACVPSGTGKRDYNAGVSENRAAGTT